MEEREEKRGRKPLSEGEPTQRVGVCLPLGMYDELCSLGEIDNKGYGHHVRKAVDAYLKKQRRAKKKK